MTLSGLFELKVTDPGDPFVVQVIGPLDAESAQLLTVWIRAAHEELGHTRIILDLSRCPFVDSIGLGAITQCRKETSVSLVLTHLNEKVARISTVTQLDRIVKIAPTIDAARQRIEEMRMVSAASFRGE